MSLRNVELHRRTVEAFNARDIEAWIAFCDPEIELHSAVTVPGGAVYHGHDGVRKWHRDLEDAWGDELHVEAEAFFDLGEHTLTFHILRGRGRHSGAEVAMPAAHVHRLARRPDRLLQGIFGSGGRASRPWGISERSRADRPLALRDGVERPASRDALQVVLAALGEPQSGAGDEIAHGARDQHLAGLGEGGDARADVDR